MSEKKIEEVKNWAVPRKVKDVQEFLRFANCYQRFIQGFVQIAVPLTALTRKDEPWSGTPQCQKDFDMLKQRFTSAPIFAHLDATLLSIIETGTSDYAVRAIHSQTQNNGRVHLVAFLSQKFSPAEMNYDIQDKDMVAIVLAFQEWIHQLKSCKQQILVWTDNRNLEYLTTSKVLSRLQARWYEFLAEFDFVVRYRPNDKIGKPDELSRRWDLRPEEGSEDLHLVHFLFKPGQLRMSAMKASQLRDPFRNTLRNTAKKNKAWLEM